MFVGDAGQQLPRLGRVQAGLRVLAQQAADHRPERAGVTWRIRVISHHSGQAGEYPVPVERWPSLDRRVQRCSQGPQVRGGGGLPAACAFGRDVGRRADQHPRCGQGRAVGRLGDPEVGEDDPAVGTEQDVGRLHIAVQDAGLVRSGERGQHAQSDPGRLAGGQGPFRRDRITERAVGYEFHHQARPAVFLEEVVDAHDVRMPEPCGHLGFPHGTLPGRFPLLRVHLRRPDDFLERHVPFQQFVPCPPDGTHPALTDNGQQPVPSGQEASRLIPTHNIAATRLGRVLTGAAPQDHACCAVNAIFRGRHGGRAAEVVPDGSRRVTASAAMAIAAATANATAMPR